MKTVFIFIAILAIILSGCKEETIINYHYWSKPGSVCGRITVNPYWGNTVDSYANVRVTLLQTGQTVLSDKNGYWTIDSVHAGVLDFSFLREDCDTAYFWAYNFPGNGTAIIPDSDIQPIYQKPVTEVILDSIQIAQVNGETGYFLNVRCSRISDLTVCLFHSPDISPYKMGTINSFYIIPERQEKFEIIPIPKIIFFNHFTKGDTVYVAVFPGRFNSYIDYRTNYTTYGGYGKRTRVLSFVYREDIK